MIEDYTTGTGSGATFGLPLLREQTNRMLGDAYSNNYIDADDYERRLVLVEAAKDRAGVFAAVADFPSSMKEYYIDIAGSGAQGTVQREYREVEPEQQRSYPAADRNSPHSVVFSTLELAYHQLDRNAVSVSSVFGTIRLDLAGLPVNEEFHIYVKSVFGEVRIEVPPNARIVRRCQTIFGEFKIRTRPADGPGPTVHIHGSVIFGEIVVKESRPKTIDKVGRLFHDFFS